MRRIIMFSLVVMTIFGCASRNAMQQPSLGLDLNAQQNKMIKNDIVLLVKATHDVNDLKAYYDEDTIRYDMG
ncbi:hypothetical protein Dacet_2187 [Denitrovibrio acetiphilus DSM 12809]|uniref:Uncharacterized protein n=1 Tax=Denitrovibrio acetiphilus (strain DSM 12809 / NBRC 114555 / N2460) TaxID=522772 RepID=D4H2F8_DENA2|nr:hypothetical protein [Denitrovibrio acetiphilus]ADD68949.1 hypothetical protein Dacet_2187 [Denitrovibrio acetiphilus DSM 12809]